MARHSFQYPATQTRPARIEYSFWLVFGSDGSMRFSRAQPKAGRGERAMQCVSVLPLSLFRTPELKAKIQLDERAAADFQIDVTAAADALRAVVGVDIDLKINQPEGE